MDIIVNFFNQAFDVCRTIYTFLNELLYNILTNPITIIFVVIFIFCCSLSAFGILEGDENEED